MGTGESVQEPQPGQRPDLVDLTPEQDHVWRVDASAQPIYRDWLATMVLVLLARHQSAGARRVAQAGLEDREEALGLMSAPLFKDGKVYLLDKHEGLSLLRAEDRQDSLAGWQSTDAEGSQPRR